LKGSGRLRTAPSLRDIARKPGSEPGSGVTGLPDIAMIRIVGCSSPTSLTVSRPSIVGVKIEKHQI